MLTLVSLVFAGCVFPTERSEDLQVVLDPIPPLIEGEIFLAEARLVEAGGATVPNAQIIFQSSNPLVALISEEGGLFTVSVGTTEITASAVAFEDAQSASETVIVRDVLSVDSLSPEIIRFGDTLSIFGAGLNPEQPFLLVTVGGAETPIATYVPDDPDVPNRFGTLKVWVPPPAVPFSQAAILGLEGLAISPDTVRVLQRDIYEPNDTIPWIFGDVEFVANPALAFETRARDDSLRADWYQFSVSVPGDRTILIQSPVVPSQTYQVFLTDSLGWRSAATDFGIGSRAWTIGPSLYTCRGIPFAPPQHPLQASIFALRNLPVGTYDIIAAYTLPGQYELAILPSYESVLPPDNSEENDFCEVAADLPFGITKNLTIDNPNDVDWFRFTVGGTGLNVSFDVIADVAEADLDLYILADNTPTSLPVVGSSKVGGVTDAVSVALPPGDYFLVVVDFAGVPTTYALATLSAVTPTPTDPSATAAPSTKTPIDRFILRSPRPR